MAQRGVPAHPTYVARWAALHRGLDGMLSVTLAQPAPGVGIPAGAAMGDSRAAGNIDATLHGTRR
jgi:hypothetical protein